MLTPFYFADRILDELHITDLRDLKLLELIAWQRGAIINDKFLRGAEARLSVIGKRAMITIASSTIDPRRRRFSIAHELGHLEMHRVPNGLAVCTKDDIDAWAARDINASREQAANEFASALLLPARFFAPLCEEYDPTLDAIASLSNIFDVSLTATAIRFTEYSPEICAVVFSQDGYIRWFRCSREFREMGLFVDVRSKVDSRSLAATHLRSESVAIGQKRVDASVWLAPGKYHRDMTILEQSRSMPARNAVLSLLWVDYDSDDDDWG